MTTSFNPLYHPAVFRLPARLSAVPRELAHTPFLSFLISVQRPRVLVELGTERGSSYCTFCQAVEADQLATRCYAIANWEGAEAEEWLAKLREHHDPRYGGFSRLWSGLPTAALPHFGDGTLDLLYFASGAALNQQTVEMWLPKLSSRGLILCSEINSAADEAAQVWDTLKKSFSHFEFMHEGGLGVLAPGGLAALEAPEVAALLAASPVETEHLRTFFAQASRALITENVSRPAYDQHVAELQREAQLLRDQLREREKRLRMVQTQLAQREQVIQQISDNHAAVVNSDAWWMINQYWSVRRTIIPKGTQRERALKLGVRFARILGQLGIGGLAFKVTSRLRRRFRPIEEDSWVDERTLKLIMTRPAIAIPDLNLPLVESAAEQVPVLAKSVVSVVIPAFNAGPEFQLLLASLSAQQGCERVELIVVDSGSTDDTVRLAREYQAQVIEITAAEFSHSHARNLGAQAATGAYLLFMVQDALPGSPLWMYELVSALRRYEAAAVSSVEAPRENADLLARILNKAHYNFLEADEEDRLLNWPLSESYDELRRNCQLCNVACLIERKTFQQYGFRGVYAEDLDLGMRLARDGHHLALLNSVKVLHSHNRAAYYHLKRGYVDSLAMAQLFHDFPRPPAIELGQLGQESLAVFQLLEQLFAQHQTTVVKPQPIGELAAHLVQGLKTLYLNPAAALAAKFDATSDDYRAFIGKLAALPAMPANGQLTGSHFASAVLEMLVYTLEYLKGITEVLDADSFESLRQCLQKAHALQLGSFLASSLINSQPKGLAGNGSAIAEQSAAATWIDSELRKGV
jgi:GT2 family glycosyltransferase/predicted O-methyltransferase YrrM